MGREAESDDDYYMSQDTLLLGMRDDTLDLSTERDLVPDVPNSDSSFNYYVANQLALIRQFKAVFKNKPVRPRLKLKDRPEESRLWDPCCRKTNVAVPPPNVKGRLREISALFLLTVMYSARVARCDLQKAIQFLAIRITCWDSFCDKALHGLMCYTYTRPYWIV